jgi:hypothetical protein
MKTFNTLCLKYTVLCNLSVSKANEDFVTKGAKQHYDKMSSSRSLQQEEQPQKTSCTNDYYLFRHEKVYKHF